MDKTQLVAQVSQLFRMTGHDVQESVQVNHREIDILATELAGLVRKVVVIECAAYAGTVGVDKAQEDVRKLEAAKEGLGHTAVLMHVSSHGYSPQALGYLNSRGIDSFTIEDLKSRLINFSPYIESVREEKLRPVIMKEYQPTTVHPEGEPKERIPAIAFLDAWISTKERWLTLLGDYGVGKSWTLRRYLYHRLDLYSERPSTEPLPIFVPLQSFRKAFNYKNLILATFDNFGLSGVYYDAFQFLAREGRILFLFDSFDEMAQVLHAEVIRANLAELFGGIRGDSRAIMTSRPTYFEGKAERLRLLDETSLSSSSHGIDHKEIGERTALSRFVAENVGRSAFARLNDLTPPQRKRLFGIVLRGKPEAQKEMLSLFDRFQELETISQRAVIARLLTRVAEMLARRPDVRTAEGQELIPRDLDHLNQGKIFEIVVYDLLDRDMGIGRLSASDRLAFLRQLALYLQQAEHDFFATPEEIRDLVQSIFTKYLERSDTPNQDLENFYRTCRRHSGLTTESQFLDTSGNIDSPVDERDSESRVGFSHNSLREYLVADAIVEHIVRGVDFLHLEGCSITELVGEFLWDLSSYRPNVVAYLSVAYGSASGRRREWLFDLIYHILRKASQPLRELLGETGKIEAVDLSDRDLSGLDLREISFDTCLAGHSDFRRSDLRRARFPNTVLEGAMFDDAKLEGSDFSDAEVVSIYVFDAFQRETSAVLKGKEARQWLFASGASVAGSEELNPYLGQPWFEAAREVLRTVAARMAGTHEDSGLAKGTAERYRGFAEEFVEFLRKEGVLEPVKKSGSGKRGTWILRASKGHYDTINAFIEDGRIRPVLAPFFEKHLRDRG